MPTKPKPRAPKAPTAVRKAIVAPRPVLQWIAAFTGLLITLAVLTVIVLEALQPRRPPALTARMVEATPTAQGWSVEVEVANRGSETAAGVEVEGILGDETASATIDYVPGDATTTAFLGFTSDPTTTPPRISVIGWSAP